MQPDLNNALVAAPALLGWKLIHDSPLGRVGGYIVETEAYTQDDPASHTFRGERPRTSSMFKEAGAVYVYFTYGMHYCLNIVTGIAGQGEAVLIRALEPIEGIDIMSQQRKQTDVHKLTSGPAKLTQALMIDRELNGTFLNSGPLKLEPGIEAPVIKRSRRIGITKATDKPWRFYIAKSSFVSVK